ncbi:interleukin 21 receptor, tandem duplicate 1 [Mugil cephalus]|uniref:interleukin 21 receptor, tandem duplicate 1 n=1 Tax=Mugil cephalus TaxID=48193 RepID=UPI001FB6A946|nr:interleukin 21 receptor, tandem duplicate 1 [Mugil cephalus]XP_047453683.1 interleukin 21 receptor, tandem duplicate 1 [Mugil cephalus]XP_047453684.1 interleukin 21 receptor, tandem duplicate 1 [Mugil cephalus]
MAPKPFFLLMLWGLTLFSHGAASLCNVTCSTDYSKSVTCSCSASVPTYPLYLEVTCRDYYGEGVSGNCEIRPPHTSCTMHIEGLDEFASTDTECNTTVRRRDERGLEQVHEETTWALSDVVKPRPPFNVSVEKTEEQYNISWDNDNNKEDCLVYRVRIRESRDLSKAPVYSLVEKQYLQVDQKNLQPHISYTVDVQAKMCPDHYYQGPWSEWSSAAEYPGQSSPGIWTYWWLLLILLAVFVACLFLGCSQNPHCQKKFNLTPFVPKPNDFFKPLYISHGGNFKEWVKPAFSEYDYLKISSSLQATSEKQQDVLHWKDEKLSYGEDGQTNHGEPFLQTLQPVSNLAPQDTSHSTGHISIHTVTLSGEESEEEVTSQSSIPSYQDGESFGSFEHAEYDLEQPPMPGMDRISGASPRHDNHIPNDLFVVNINFQPNAQFNEPERVSLDSFVSNLQSEDGYPHVDLDTIDSGFGECSSPGASDSNTAERMDSDLFHEQKNSNSNYVKQWMICSTIQEDSGNTEDELHDELHSD